MDTQTYDVLVELGAFVEPPDTAMKGRITILGKKYNLPQDKGAMTKDFQTRLWCTYRKNFRAISGTSLTTDTGWGCTLRCGQMLMAQTLLCLHLGRDWIWQPREDDPTYMRILRKFLDIRDSEYSLQMIALQGADFGRPVGNWFGPNNVAQAIRKLSVHDDFSRLAVHVAMDMVLVVEDLKKVCREPHVIPGQVNVTTEDDLKPRSYSDTLTALPERSNRCSPSRSNSLLPMKTGPSTALSRQQSEGQNSQLRHTIVKKNTIEELKAVKQQHNQQLQVNHQLLHKRRSKVKQKESIEFTKVDHDYFDDEEGESDEDTPVYQATNKTLRSPTPRLGSCEPEEFRPLLVFIPLRLGQETFNAEYSESLKACLTLPQSVGFIGGRPRHALYFIGFCGDQLLYLDPHTTQQTVNPADMEHIPDSSYHCSQPDRMSISELDPSIALGFFCRDERDIDDLCERLKERVVNQGMYTMFELTDTRPSYWGPLSQEPFQSIREPFLLVDGDGDFVDKGDSDEEFEIIEWPPGPLLSIPPGCLSSTPQSNKKRS